MPNAQTEIVWNEVAKFDPDIYMKENPHLYTIFKAKAEALLKAGRSRYGGRAIMEVVRYEMALKTGSDGFKINNSVIPFLVRKLQKEDERFIGFFETRGRR